MSLLSGFIADQLLKAVEAEFIAHAPDVKDKIIEEMQLFGNQCIDWVNAKLAAKNGE